jgi:hypothetical protein
MLVVCPTAMLLLLLGGMGVFRQSQKDDPYDWNLMEGYNAHAARVLQERRRAQLLTPSTSTKTTVIRLLNVWNATILRKDGHVGFDDCLHYNLPGPTDWWVHFWYAALQDLAVLEQDKTVYE